MKLGDDGFGEEIENGAVVGEGVVESVDAVALAGEFDVGDGAVEFAGAFGEAAAFGDGDAAVVFAVDEQEGSLEAFDVVDGGAVAEFVGFGFGIAGFEDDPVGDVGGFEEGQDVGEAGGGDAEAEGVGFVAIVGMRGKGEGAHGCVAAVASAEDADLVGFVAVLGFEEAGGVEDVDDFVAAEVAVVERGEFCAKAAGAAWGGAEGGDAGFAHDLRVVAEVVSAAVESGDADDALLGFGLVSG